VPTWRAAPSGEASQFGLDERGNGGERIGDIVDEDLDVDGVDRGKAGHAPSSSQQLATTNQNHTMRVSIAGSLLGPDWRDSG
jgi:hypothetical protein